MLIFLYGPDDYRRKEKERFYVAEFKKKYSHLGLGKFDLVNEGEFEKFQEFVRNRSIFEVAKLVFVEGVAEAGEDIVRDVIQELKPLVEEKSTTVIISGAKKPPQEFAPLMKKAFKVEKFEALSGYEWEKFVRSEAKARNVPLAEDAVRFLAEAYAGDSWRLVTELEKLSFLRRTAITREDLEQLDIEISPDFFALLNTLKRGLSSSFDAKGLDGLGERLTALERMFAENEPAAKIFNILAAQSREEQLSKMANYDLAVKSGKMDYEEVLTDFVLGS